MEQQVLAFSHKQIASQCFNKVWDLLDQTERTPLEQEQMIHLAHTSFWHWTQVEDHTPTNLSIGYWQISRVYAVVGNGEQSIIYANRCLEVSLQSEIAPFHIGYAYEAQARAYKVLNQIDQSKEAYEKCLDVSNGIIVEDSKKMLLKDLEDIREWSFA